MVRLLLVWSALTWVIPVHPQHAWTRRLGAEPGHPAHSVYRMLVDHEGMLWLSSSSGVYSYDGVSFERLEAGELQGALVLLFKEDTLNDCLWMAAHGGAVFSLERRSGQVRSYGYPPFRKPASDIKARSLLPRADGTVLVGYDNGQGAFALKEDGSWTRLEVPGEEHGMYLWHTVEGLIGCTQWDIRPDTMQVYTWSATGEGNRTRVERVDGGWHAYHKWIGRRYASPVFTVGERLCWWRSDGTLRTEFYDRYVVRLFEDHADRLWTLEYLGRLRCYDANGDLLSVRMPDVDGLHTTDIVEDHQGGIWVSTLGNGLFRALPFAVGSLPQDDPAAPGFTCMAAAPDGGLLTGSLLGQVVHWAADMVEEGRWSLTPASEAVDVKGVQWCAEHQAVEASGPRVLARLNEEHPRVWHTERSYAAYAYAQVHLGADSLLVLNPNGLMLLPEGPPGVLEELWTDGRCFSAVHWRDTIWIASTRGVLAVDPARQVHGPLVNGRCPDIVKWQDGLVAALRDSGLVRHTASGGWARWAPHPWAAKVAGLDVDAEGGLWLATSEGVLGLDTAGRVVWRSDRISGVSLGGVDDVVVQPDAVWTIGERAIHRLARRSGTAIRGMPVPRFTRCMASGRELVAGPTIALGAEQRDVSLHFRVALPARMGDERYRVRMGQGDWSELGSGRLDLFNLGAGRQRVEVQAALGGGEWGPSGVLDLEVAPLLHETWWARTALVVLLVLSLVVFLRWREARMHRRLAVQRSLSEMRLQALTSSLEPHFVFNALNGVQSYLARNEKEEGMRYLARFSRLMRGLLEAGQARAIPLRQEVELLEHYCSLESLRFDPPFTWRVHVAPDLEMDRIHVQPYLVQPYVENAVRHGLWHAEGAGRKLEVAFDREMDGLLRCTITDNGVGRAEAMKRAGTRERMATGLRTNAERLQLLGQGRGQVSGRVTVEDLMYDDGRPAGTRVTLVLPITWTSGPET